ncbi:MAG: 50S ribosomal protein L29 [Saprospiraceae bacterium]
MASKKFIELQEFSLEDLQNELTETQAQYKKLKFDHAINGLENPLLLRDIRRDIARMHTELRGREVAVLTPEEVAKRSKIRFRRK